MKEGREVRGPPTGSRGWGVGSGTGFPSRQGGPGAPWGYQPCTGLTPRQRPPRDLPVLFFPPAQGHMDANVLGGVPSRAPDPTQAPHVPSPLSPPSSSSWLLGPHVLWPPPSTLCPAAEAPQPRLPADFPHRSPSFTSPTPAPA